MDVLTQNRDQADRLYRAALELVEQRGWRRIEEGEGWWWNPDADLLADYPLGEVFELELQRAGVDTRLDPEPVVFMRPPELQPGMFVNWWIAALYVGSCLLSVTAIAALLWWAL